MTEGNNQTACSVKETDDCRCNQRGGGCINSRFTLSVIAIILSCFSGFWTIPLALAALILSLRAQDLAYNGRTEEASRTAWWAGFFGWITVGIVVLPIVLIIFFGGAIVAFLGSILATI